MATVALPACVLADIDRVSMRRWRDPRYLLDILGHRTVPVECGRDYLAPRWGQRLLAFHDFLYAAGAVLPAERARQASPPPGRELGTHDSAGVASSPAACAAAAGAKRRRMSDAAELQTGGAAARAGSERTSSGRNVTGSGWIDGGASSEEEQGRRREVDGAEEIACSEEAPEPAPGAREASGALYLAQHALLEQVPALRRDILVRVAARRHARVRRARTALQLPTAARGRCRNLMCRTSPADLYPWPT